MPRKPGQTKYSEALEDALLSAIRSGLTNKDACTVAGISEDTFTRWGRGQRGIPADFAERVARARAQRTQLLLGTIRRAGVGIRKVDDQGRPTNEWLIEPDWRAAGEFLDRTAP